MEPEALIEDALFSHLQQFTPALPTAYPNDAFTPPSSGMYLRASHQPNRTVTATFGDAGWDRMQGILQIDVVAPEDTGTLPAARVAGALIAHFNRARLPAGDLIVRVQGRPDRAGAMEANGWSMTPVTVRYFCDVQNT